MLKRTHPSLDVPTDTRQTRNKVELEQRTRRKHGATGRGTRSVVTLPATQTGSSENCPGGCLSQTLAFGPPRALAGNKAVRVSFPEKKTRKTPSNPMCARRGTKAPRTRHIVHTAGPWRSQRTRLQTAASDASKNQTTNRAAAHRHMAAAGGEADPALPNDQLSEAPPTQAQRAPSSTAAAHRWVSPSRPPRPTLSA